MGVAGLKSLGVAAAALQPLLHREKEAASSSQAANDDTSWMKSKKPIVWSDTLVTT